MSEIIKQINVDGVDYDIVGKELTKITYAELKALRDNGQLSEGHLYRITDYVTTTTQENTKSAGNVFDVIVLAVSASELSHIARAIQHEGDTYFDGNDLGAWELWYDLDNDTEKYEWADATKGKGVIYRMIDEKRNDCPYDFKNILFYNDKLKNSTTSDKYYYTFSYVVSGKLYDGTVEKQAKYCYSNSMGVYIKNKKKSLNQNVLSNGFFDSYCHSNTFGNCCYSNTFGYGCYYNSFSNYCYSNTFSYICHSNTFQTDCYLNTFQYTSHSNTFNHTCALNTFRGYCTFNTFGHYCNRNTFVDDCDNNTFDDNCSDNTFGRRVNHRHIGKDKTFITLNDEYYDDGSGKLVPIKHPDLSTQPSILPYKFMGQYVYEQLIPVSVDLITKSPYRIKWLDRGVDKPLILEGFEIVYGLAKAPTGAKYPSSMMVDVHNISYEGFEYDGENSSSSTIITVSQNEAALDVFIISGAYLRIVYTSMPEEGGDYYGYNNY